MLETLSRSSSAPHREVLRARALVLAADGVANDRIAAEVGVSATSVRSWRRRFADDGLTRFGRVRPGRGAKPSIPPEMVEAIVAATLTDVVGLYLDPPGAGGGAVHGREEPGAGAGPDPAVAADGEGPRRHRHEEFLKFLRTIDRQVPTGLAVHLILDNYATQKHPDVKAWVGRVDSR